MSTQDLPTLTEYSLKQVDKNELPRERLRRLGANALKNEELIAIILRTGSQGEDVLRLAERMLRENGGLAGLARLPFSEMTRVRGIGEVKAIELQAVFELGRRLLLASPEERPAIKSPADAANLLNEMGVLEQETMRTILLDTKNRVVAMPTVYRGSLHTTVIRITELFREAVRQNCAALILAHNHPSGDPAPSAPDLHVTRQLREAARAVDIDLLDHIIVGRVGADPLARGYFSFREAGML